MATLSKKSEITAVGVFFGLVALALSGNVMAAKCEVTSGPNKGKQGYLYRGWHVVRGRMGRHRVQGRFW